jgi:hypothetical protein
LYLICFGTDVISQALSILQASVIGGPFVSTGNLFASLLLPRLHPFTSRLVPSDDTPTTDLPLAIALEFIIASMQGVLKTTKKAMDLQIQKDSDVGTSEKERLVKLMRVAELHLVVSQDALLHPEVVIKAVGCNISE